MFAGTPLKEFNVPSGILPKLENAWGMFSDTLLKTFKTKLPNVRNGDQMFEGCSKLRSIVLDAPELEYGYKMFFGCKNLQEIELNFPKISHAGGMFQGCQLSEELAFKILDAIPEYSDSDRYNNNKHNLHLGINMNFKNSQKIAELLGTKRPVWGMFHYKGWDIEIANKNEVDDEIDGARW